MPETKPSQRPERAAFRVDPPPYDPDAIPPCPDHERIPAKWEIAAATLWEGKFREGRLLDWRTKTYTSKDQIRRRVARLREVAKIRESLDWFSYGATAGMPNLSVQESPLTSQYVPLVPGPATRQQYWADYWASSAKSFEAYHHDPIAHRVIELTGEFILGRGIEARFEKPTAQKVWDEFAERERLDEKLEQIATGLSVYGELFIRWFPLPKGQLTFRALDPATIYEVITDQEDLDSVYAFHQQFTTRAQLYAPPAGNLAPTGPTQNAVVKYVIRQIPAQEIDHVRINAQIGEVRGRSDLFPVLGYLKRFRDLMTSRVVKSDMEARMVYKLVADGTSGDLVALQAKLFPKGRAPAPGTVLGFNRAADLEPMQFQNGSDTGVDTDVEALVNLLAVGTGVPKEYLWQAAKGGGARANALIATEPGAKRFEKRQRLVERLLRRMADRVFDGAGIGPSDRDGEFIFPSIASEDRSTKLKDLAFAESMSWVSKETAATTAAKELDNSTFDFEDEQKRIADEWTNANDEDDPEPDAEPTVDPITGEEKPAEPKPAKGGDGVIRRPMISAQYRQAPKLDPTKAPSSFEDEPGGTLVPLDGGALPGQVGQPGQPGGGPGPEAKQTRAGMPTDENPASAEGAANIRRDNARESLELTPAGLGEVIRESRRLPRRRPDDPEFQKRAAAYSREAREGLDQLVDDVKEGEK